MSSPTTIRHKLAAVAAAAAVALAGAALARRPPDAVAGLADRPADLEQAQPALRVPTATATTPAPAAASLPSASGLVAAAGREEIASHRRLLAGRLAAQLGRLDASRIESAMAARDAELRAALRGGARPGSLATKLGLSEEELEAAFEGVALHGAAGVRDGTVSRPA